jgi:GNAT superfamily N-acetyltransferase
MRYGTLPKSPPTLIRPATPEDSGALAQLLVALAYPTEAMRIAPRLAALAQERSTTVQVAEVDGVVVGLVTVHAFFAIHTDVPTAYLTALVVKEPFRRRGIGRVLATAAEEWARTQGAVRLSLLSGESRGDAHRFYELIGYERTGQRYTKRLVD